MRKIVEANECFGSDSSTMSPEEFTRYDREKPDHHKVLHEKIRQSPHGNNVQIRKFLDVVEDEAKSKYFKDRLLSMIRTSWLTSVTFGNISSEKLCIISDFLTSAVLAENGINNDQDWTCTMQEAIYSAKDYCNDFVKLILFEQGCQTPEMLELELPKCFNSSACAKEGREYLFDEIWMEYDSYETELGKAGKDSHDAKILLAIAKELHSSQDFYENYVAAVMSVTVVATDWFWKANVMDSHLAKEIAMKLGLMLEAASTVQKCDCGKLESSLRDLLESFLQSFMDLFDIFKSRTEELGSHGHISSLRGRRGKSAFRN